MQPDGFRFDWRRHLLPLLGTLFILVYVGFMISDLATGRGFEDFWFYIAMIVCLSICFSARIDAPGKDD